ncbi:hypothetical protein ZIOFF_022262 [Zingiber officinale]|uniref:Uncharacterized protein n=1 Tax=Zingiber officinale TaxID=94328 RepID=A0A8J5HL66_ZINOF|nr:hypothetical protein ZIOFF_022262 [Zingiber officinale]
MEVVAYYMGSVITINLTRVVKYTFEASVERKLRQTGYCMPPFSGKPIWAKHAGRCRPSRRKMEISSTLAVTAFEILGYVVISLADVVNNKRINEKYHLIDSKNGCVQVELQWRTS